MIPRSLRRLYHWHWQNLDEDRHNRIKGRGWRHGRAWLSVGPTDERNYNRPYEFGVEWIFGRFRPLLSLRAALGEGDSDQEAAGHVGIPGATVYVHGLTPLTRRLTRLLCGADRYRREREFSLRLDLHDGIWWCLWADPMSWENSRPRWRDGHLDLREAIFGRPTYVDETLEERAIVIGMPEGTYQATARLFLSTWTHSRFGWPRRRIVRCDVQIPVGIAHPGKGENAWDCDDDALFGWCGPAETIPEAIGKVVTSVLRDRERYGGYSWQPATPAPLPL